MRQAILLALLVSMPAVVLAEDEAPLEEVVVSGEFPGPGMWKVLRPDDDAGHVLWIIGDPPPLPKRLRWKSREVEVVVRGSAEVLRDATVTMKPEEGKVGFFRGMSLLPSMLKARRNPEGSSLSEQLPPELHARWLVQKKRYLGRERGVEHWRPIFAADKLRREAYEDLDLRERGMVWEVVGRLAERHDIPVTTPELTFTFKASELRAKIKEFSRESLADVECFSTTLDFTEALSDRATESARARAWATGDLAALERLPELPNPGVPCISAIMGSQVAREVIPSNIRAQLQDLWIDAARRSLDRNQVTFAIVPLSKLMRADGYLSTLRALGYRIDPPK